VGNGGLTDSIESASPRGLDPVPILRASAIRFGRVQRCFRLSRRRFAAGTRWRLLPVFTRSASLRCRTGSPSLACRDEQRPRRTHFRFDRVLTTECASHRGLVSRIPRNVRRYENSPLGLMAPLREAIRSKMRVVCRSETRIETEMSPPGPLLIAAREARRACAAAQRSGAREYGKETPSSPQCESSPGQPETPLQPSEPNRTRTKERDAIESPREADSIESPRPPLPTQDPEAPLLARPLRNRTLAETRGTLRSLGIAA
jgi:hypothetical protein